VYSELLEEDHIQNILSCKYTKPPGKIPIVGNKPINKNITSSKIDLKRICAEWIETKTKLFKTQRKSHEAVNLCRNLGGFINLPKYPFDDFNDLDKHGTCTAFWVPIGYNETAKQWQGIITQKDVGSLNWSTNFPLNKETRKCVYLFKESKSFTNERCNVELCHYCHFAERVQFGLHGMCKDSIIDTDYNSLC
jgi:hypothetical protein